MTRVIDFDAFRAEQNAEAIVLKIGGHTYPLPASLPASLALDIIRRNGDDSTMELPPTELIPMGEAIFGGSEMFGAILTQNGVTMNELPELFKMVFALYNGEPEVPNLESPDSTPEAETATSL